MKARGIFVSLLIILICALFFINSCGKSDSPSSAKAITEYSLNGVAGTINETEKTIAVTMPVLTNVTALVATFNTTGTNVNVGITAQESGTTANNFTSPVAYTVIAADGSTATYTVTVKAGAWYNPASTTDNISPDGQNAYWTNYIWHKQIAMDDNGNIIIVWMESDGTNSHIFKSERWNGIWTYPANLSDHISLNGQDAIEPHVAMDNNGNAIIVWMQSDGANLQVFKSERRNGVWANPTSLSDHISPSGQDVGWNDPLMGTAQVAMDNNGNAIIVWYQSDGSTQQIFKSEYRNGAWQHPANLADNIGITRAAQPQVAMDDNDNAIIVFIASDGSYSQIFKSEYRNGSWHHAASNLDNISPDGRHAFAPQVAMANNGDAVIVWGQFGNDTYRVYKSEYRSGAWVNPTDLSDFISPNWGRFPQVEMENNGNAIIIWDLYFNTDSDPYGMIEYRNSAWSNPVNLKFNGENIRPTHMAMDDNGNAIIVWPQSDSTKTQVFKSEYRNGAWHDPTNLSDNISSSGQGGNNPLVAMGNNGEAIIAYQGSDGTNCQIFKSEYR
jgi:hypothetical protein